MPSIEILQSPPNIEPDNFDCFARVSSTRQLRGAMESQNTNRFPLSGLVNDRSTLPKLSINPNFWSGRPVFVTGHTGFMGCWLIAWLNQLGAHVFGYSLSPPSVPSMYETAGIRRVLCGETIADIRDKGKLSTMLQNAHPDVVFHLAAQPIVRYARHQPIETFEVNVIGTGNLLEASRIPDVRAGVVVTSDKVYRNMEWDWEYREGDPLGGHEPYGASKACAELVAEAYRASYFEEKGVGVATARAGNIIGGGDWAADRLIPDAVRAFSSGETLLVRNPDSYRPWQHVLESIHGLLVLAERLTGDPARYSQAWNFGPIHDDHQRVSFIVDRCAHLWGAEAKCEIDGREGPYEGKRLAVSSARAIASLDWRPVWRLEETLARTIDWYRCHINGADLWAKTLDDISAFAEASKQRD
jgi:CDP-glucose 4,6-dehydratase